MYETIFNELVSRGFSEETASTLAELIDDAGWDTVRDALNVLEDRRGV